MADTIEKPEKVYMFQVLAGEHQGNKRAYKQGDCFQSQFALDEIYAGKFQRLPSQPLPPDDVPVPVPVIDDVVNGAQLVDEDVMVPFSFADASNVTHLFSIAKAAGLSVFKDEMGRYAVAEAEALVPVNLADHPLSSKKGVNAFLADFKPSTEMD